MMNEYRIIITPVAGEELTAIHDWIAKDSPDSAAKVITRILDALEPLRSFPHRTIVEHQGKEIVHPVRSLAVWPYVVLFRVLDSDNVVRILHVRHGALSSAKEF